MNIEKEEEQNDNLLKDSSSSSFSEKDDNSSNNGDYSLILNVLGDFVHPSINIDKHTFNATNISKPTLVPNENRIVLKTQAGLLFNKEKNGM